MTAVVTKFFKERRLALLAYTASMVAFLELYVVLFPSMQSQAQQINEIVKSMPKAFMEAFGVNATQLSFNNLETLLASKQFGMIWPLILIIFAISIANAAISGEVEDGTMSNVLAQPISRLKIFLSRYFSGVVIISIFTFCSIMAVIPLAKLSSITASLHNNWVLTVSGLAFGLAVLSLAFLASALFSTKGRAIMMMSGIFLIMYIVNVVSNLKDSLVNLKYVSFFYYYNAAVNQINGEYVKWEFWVFLGCALLFTTLGAMVFVNRDIMV